MKASKALTVSVSVFRGRISWRFSLSKNISPAAPDLELILFPLWYWPIMKAHAQSNNETRSVWNSSQKSDPPFAHLLALSHIYINSSQKSDPPFAHLLALSHIYIYKKHSNLMWLYAVLILPAHTFLTTLAYLLASGEFSPKNVGCCCVLCCINNNNSNGNL